MKKLSIVITVPLLVVAIVVAVAFIIKATQTPPVSTENQPLPAYNPTVGKPASGFSSAANISAVGDLAKELEATVDDGGASDVGQLQKDAAGL